MREKAFRESYQKLVHAAGENTPNFLDANEWPLHRLHGWELWQEAWQAALAHAVEVLDDAAWSFELEADQLAHCETRQCRTASTASKAAALALREAAAKLREK